MNSATLYRIRLVAVVVVLALVLAGAAFLLGRGLTPDQDRATAQQGPTTAAPTSAPSGYTDNDTATPIPPDPSSARPTVWDSSTNSPLPTDEPTTAAPKDGELRATIPDPDQVDRRDPDAVAAAFVDTLHTVDTNIDPRPAAAARRAAVYATDDLADDLRTEPAGAPGNDWTELTNRSAWTEVETRPDSLGPQPTDTKASAVRVISATITATDDNGTDQPQQVTHALQLTKDDDRWQVQRYTTTT